jgi:hypothetical protein
MRILIMVGLACLVGCGGDDTSTGDAATVTDDAATVDGAIGLECGTMTCDATQDCCVQAGGAQSCVATGTCQGTTFACDGNEDCASTERCCPVAGGGTECTTGTTCQIPSCEMDTDCPTQGHKCCSVGTQKVCAPNCPGMGM